MIEKSAPSLRAGFVSGLLDLNHTRVTSVLQIAKFAPRVLQNEANFAIRTLAVRSDYTACLGESWPGLLNDAPSRSREVDTCSRLGHCRIAASILSQQSRAKPRRRSCG